jgi:hypothetical protein
MQPSYVGDSIWIRSHDLYISLREHSPEGPQGAEWVEFNLEVHQLD